MKKQGELYLKIISIVLAAVVLAQLPQKKPKVQSE